MDEPDNADAAPPDDPAALAERIAAVVADQPGICVSDVAVALGLDDVEEVTALDLAWDVALGDHVVLAHPDRAVPLPRGLVLRHRLTDDEVEHQGIHASFDLALLGAPGTYTGEAGEIHVDRSTGADLHGPHGWLDHPAGTLLAFRVDGERLVVEVAEEAPAPDADDLAAFRAAYDAAVEDGIAPSSLEIAGELLLTAPGWFDVARPPLREVAEAAGLEVRGGVAGHDETVWAAERRAQHARRAFEDLGRDGAEIAIRALDLAFDATAAAPDDLRRTLREVTDDPEVLLFLVGELFGADPEAEAHGHAFAAALLEVANRPDQEATARWFAALSAEREGDLALAETHLDLGHEAVSDDPRLIDRLAWYASDRGDADRALRLWSKLDQSGVVAADVAVLRAVTADASAAARTPRNAPCWCGSGRKFKQCHLGKPADLALTDRLPWLYRKATAYLYRRGGEVQDELFGVALALAGVDDDDFEDIDPAGVVAAMTHPVVPDLLLWEGGWLAQFVEERGAILPADEREVIASWVDDRRSVVDVVAHEGEESRLRDRRSGDEVVVAGTVGRVGATLVARLDPGPEGELRVIGPVVPIDGAVAAAVLHELDEGDPEEIAALLGELA